MGFIKNLLHSFKKKERKDESIQTDTEFNEQLIEMFKNDHQELLKIYADILNSFNTNQKAHKNIVALLNDFKIALEIHLMVEDNKLYSFLKMKYGRDDTHMAFVEDIQGEMNNIAKEVMFFIRKYSNRESYDNNLNNFIRDLEAIGTVLIKRIDMEEKRLYPLYMK
jgi:hemerythrin-like domain-containing protein